MKDARLRTIAAGTSLALVLGAATIAPAAAASSEPVAIPGDGYDIAGVFVTPDGDGAAPAVLMLHGYASSADEVGGMYAWAAEALAERGVGSLRIDFAGMGASEASTLDYDWDSMTGDASTALDWLVEQDGVDPERVGVLGFSNGAMIGSYLVGTDERPAAFASWSGAIYDGDANAMFLEPSLAACEEAGEGQIELDLGWRLIDHSCDYFSSMLGGTALTEFASFDGPLLLLAGSADESVDPAVSENAVTASASTDVTHTVIEGADHIFNVLTEDQAMAEEVVRITADWFAEKL
ncbi:MAG: alpha/beta fold hydrolase [Candidatus Limnocylindrales bacterium]